MNAKQEPDSKMSKGSGTPRKPNPSTGGSKSPHSERDSKLGGMGKPSDRTCTESKRLGGR